MKIVAISDTHGHHEALDLPEGDILIHAGDFCPTITLTEAMVFFDWFSEVLGFKHKVCIAGNHEFPLQDNIDVQREFHETTDFTYLEDSSVSVEGLRIYGSPWTPTFGRMAFMRDRGAAIAAEWNLIPDDVDVLVTHGPPMGILDAVVRRGPFGAGIPVESHEGCGRLLQAVERTKPKIHIFGHIHQGYGQHETEHTRFVNAAIVAGKDLPLNAPQVIEV